jgi:signal peptidase I
MENKEKSLYREYAEAIVLALIFALLIRTYVVQAFKIPSGSMIPTLLVGDQILVDKLVYIFREPERGDIIVFKYPEDPSRDFIKRLIGLPGEKLEVRNRVVYINDEPLKEESYAFHEHPDDFLPIARRDNYGPVTIPEGSYFMMGDNRENSADSRWWGFLDRSMVVGRAFMTYWSRDLANILPLGMRWERFGMIIK